MYAKLPALFEGHAPFALHTAFDAALAEFEAWVVGEAEPTVELEGVSVPVSIIFGRMRNCEDLLPARLVADVEALTGEALGVGGAASFADASRILRQRCVERLKEDMPHQSSLSAAAINAVRAGR